MPRLHFTSVHIVPQAVFGSVCVCVSGVVLIETPRCSLGLNVSGSGFSQFGMGDRDLQWISNYLNLLGAAWERAAPRCHQPVTEKAGLV